jgi:hypothetical protein
MKENAVALFEPADSPDLVLDGRRGREKSLGDIGGIMIQ